VSLPVRSTTTDNESVIIEYVAFLKATVCNLQNKMKIMSEETNYNIKKATEKSNDKMEKLLSTLRTKLKR
jgi:hypothetical protein